MKSEAKIQSQCFRWFSNNYCLKHHDPQCSFFAIPNEAIQNRSWKEISKFKATGLKSGVSDTIVLMPGKCLFVEFKTPEGRQSKSQVNFQYQVEALGFHYYICRSLEGFKDIISRELE